MSQTLQSGPNNQIQMPLITTPPPELVLSGINETVLVHGNSATMELFAKIIACSFVRA